MALLLTFVFAYILLVMEKYLYKKSWHDRLDVSMSFDVQGIPCGGTCHLEEVIKNEKKMPIPFLDIKFSVDSSLVFENEINASVTDRYYRRDVFSISGYRKIVRRLKLKGAKRGFYSLDKVDVLSYDYLYSEKELAVFNSDASIIVYPERIDVRRLSMVYQDLAGETGRKKSMEDPFAFRGMRDYVHGDPVKHINQKATARNGRPIVNLFEMKSTQKFMIVCDLHSQMNRDSEELLEKVISVSVSLAEELILNGMEVGFVSNGENNLGEKIFIPFGTGNKTVGDIDKNTALIDLTGRVAELNDMEDIYDDKSGDVIYLIISSGRAGFLSDYVKEKRENGVLASAVLVHRTKDIKDLFMGKGTGSYTGVYPFEAD